MISRKTLIGQIVAGAALAFAVAACSASTSHIASVSVGTDKDVTTPATTFGPKDDIFAKADAANVAGKVTVLVQLEAVQVAGQQPNTIIKQFDKSFDMDSDGTVDYHLSPPTAGWPAGSYKILVTMTEDGTQRDQKSADFTVSG
jgi:hypothetical protein